MMMCPTNRFDNKANVKCPIDPKHLMCKSIPWWTCQNYQLEEKQRQAELAERKTIPSRKKKEESELAQ